MPKKLLARFINSIKLLLSSLSLLLSAALPLDFLHRHDCTGSLPWGLRMMPHWLDGRRSNRGDMTMPNTTYRKIFRHCTLSSLSAMLYHHPPRSYPASLVQRSIDMGQAEGAIDNWERLNDSVQWRVEVAVIDDYV